MIKGRHQHCEVFEIRCEVQAELNLPAVKGEGAKEFWSRVEKAGLLVEALDLYDEWADVRADCAKMPRETKQEFAQRIKREGRWKKAELIRKELLASGLSQREAQAELVHRMQPLDGREARAWKTPDPWEAGRLFRKKADQDLVLRQAYEAHSDEEVAEDRLNWARFRQRERQALLDARRRARDLKASASKGTGSQTPAPAGQA